MAEAGFPPGVVNLVTGARRRGRRRDRRLARRRRSSRSPARRRRASRSPRRRASGSSACPWSSAARTASSSWPTPTSTSPRTGSCGRRSGRPASAARPRRGSSSSSVVARAARSSASRRAPGRCAWDPGSTTASTSGRSSTPAAVDKVESYVDIGRGEGRAGRRRRAGRPTAPSRTATSSSRRSSPASRRWTGSARRRSSARSCRSSRSTTTARRCSRSTRPATGCRRAIFTRDVNHGVPGDARLRDRASCTSTPARPAPRRTCRSAAGRRPATAIARPATSRSTRTPSGSRSTSTSAADSSAPRSTTSRRSRRDARVNTSRIVAFADLAAAVLEQPPRLGPVRLVAIDGPGGAGKSDFATRLAAALGDAPIVHTDDFAGVDEQFDWWPALERDVLVPLGRGEAAAVRAARLVDRWVQAPGRGRGSGLRPPRGRVVRSAGGRGPAEPARVGRGACLGPVGARHRA